MIPKKPRPTRIGRREAIEVLGATSAAAAFGGGGPLTSERSAMQAATSEILRHGAYVCLRVPAEARRAAAEAAVPALAERLELRNEFDPGSGGHPGAAIAFLRRLDAAPAEVADEDLLQAYAILHVAARTERPVAEFCTEVTRLLPPAVKPRILRGVVRPPRYTGAAMHDFAYAHQVLQQSGSAMPNGFLIPMNKTAAWWVKGWMERHTYFLPRYDEAGRMVSQGHALAAAAGIPCLMRRTYRNQTEPAPAGAYDFINYFECADADVPTFRAVCTALRDVNENPEWKFVHEGPTWHGRRVGTWPELFS